MAIKKPRLVSKAQEPKKITRVEYVLDTSWSMTWLRNDLQTAIRVGLAQELTAAKSIENHEIQWYVTFFPYGGTYGPYFLTKDTTPGMVSLPSVPMPGGGTPLLDTIYEAASRAEKFVNTPITGKEDRAAVVRILTDGDENDSHRPFSYVAEFVQQLDKRDDISFVAQVPERKGRQYLIDLGFPEGNVALWEVSARGLAKATGVYGSSVMGYTVARGAGKKKVSNFFTLDLSAVTKKQVKNSLKPLPGNEYQLLRTVKEVRIKPFVEAWTKEPYRRGSAYYEFLPRARRKNGEIIQAGKEIAIQHRVDSRVYVGRDAREILGLPDYNVTVKPGDHGDWRVFVQSTSDNRILPANTLVLVMK